VTPQALQPPVDAEKPRHGAGGVDCHSCAKGIEGTLWSNEHWKVRTFAEPAGLPMVAFLETREHYDFGELPDELAVELGPLMLKVQRAVFAIGDEPIDLTVDLGSIGLAAVDAGTELWSGEASAVDGGRLLVHLAAHDACLVRFAG